MTDDEDEEIINSSTVTKEKIITNSINENTNGKTLERKLQEDNKNTNEKSNIKTRF